MHRDMAKNLYERKKLCPATKSNITLTDEIKEMIMRDHIYTDNKNAKMSEDKAKRVRKGHPGFIYIVQLREHIRSKQPVYKIGRTNDIFGRIDQYPKDSKLLYAKLVKNHVHVETELIKKSSFRFDNQTQIRYWK